MQLCFWIAFAETQYQHPAVKNYDLRQHIRMIMCGAAPLSHELNQQLFEMFPAAHIGQAYGM